MNQDPGAKKMFEQMHEINQYIYALLCCFLWLLCYYSYSNIQIQCLMNYVYSADFETISYILACLVKSIGIWSNKQSAQIECLLLKSPF